MVFSHRKPSTNLAPFHYHTPYIVLHFKPHPLSRTITIVCTLLLCIPPSNLRSASASSAHSIRPHSKFYLIWPFQYHFSSSCSSLHTHTHIYITYIPPVSTWNISLVARSRVGQDFQRYKVTKRVGFYLLLRILSLTNSVSYRSVPATPWPVFPHYEECHAFATWAHNRLPIYLFRPVFCR